MFSKHEWESDTLFDKNDSEANNIMNVWYNLKVSAYIHLHCQMHKNTDYEKKSASSEYSSLTKFMAV